MSGLRSSKRQRATRCLGRRTAQRLFRQFEARVKIPGVGGVELVLHLGLAFEQFVHVAVGVGKGIVDLFELGEQIDDLLYPFLDHFAHRLALIQQRLLLQIADAVALGEDRLAVELLVDAGHDPQQGRLARTVQAEHADLGAIEIGQRDVLDDRLFVVVLADPHHRIDNFFCVFAHA
jgi:hypothetical protein